MRATFPTAAKAALGSAREGVGIGQIIDRQGPNARHLLGERRPAGLIKNSSLE